MAFQLNKACRYYLAAAEEFSSLPDTLDYAVQPSSSAALSGILYKCVNSQVLKSDFYLVDKNNNMLIGSKSELLGIFSQGVFSISASQEKQLRITVFPISQLKHQMITKRQLQ